ncbi:TPA: hypothetical protein SIA39_003994 [Aeromonas sobria]|nr:hypothetical protein [Aeromonas sobria]
MKLNDVAAYVMYGALVMSTGMGLAACTEQYEHTLYQQQNQKTFCAGTVAPRNTTAQQDINEIESLTLLK